MRLHRIYHQFKAQSGDHILIENDKAHYIRNVLRLKVNRQFRIFNHNDQEFLAKVISLNKKNIEVLLLESIATLAPSSLDLTLIQGLSKGDRMDYTIQKATELGINTITPIISEYCEVKLDDKRLQKKLKHWQNIAISACEQSFRNDIPLINTPISISKYSQQKHQGLLLEPQETTTLKKISSHNWKTFDIVIGPEGGWSEQDLIQLKSTGLTGINFGQRILRTETMAPAILAAIHSLWGDFT